MEKSNFSKNLKRIRKQKGFSQYDLADASGISQRMIAHYETQIKEPPLSKIQLIAHALNTPVSEFFKINDENQIDISQFDTRSLKKLQDILSLSNNDRADLYRMLNKMLRKNQLEKEHNKITETLK